MNRERAIRTADCWRVGKMIQQAWSTDAFTHESISKAKKDSRLIGRCVVLREEECGTGEQECGLFRIEAELAK